MKKFVRINENMFRFEESNSIDPRASQQMLAILQKMKILQDQLKQIGIDGHVLTGPKMDYIFDISTAIGNLDELLGGGIEESAPHRMATDKDPNVVPSPGSPIKAVADAFGPQWEFHKTQKVDTEWVHSFVDYTGKDERTLFVCLKDMELYYAYDGDRAWQKYDKNSKSDDRPPANNSNTSRR